MRRSFLLLAPVFLCGTLLGAPGTSAQTHDEPVGMYKKAADLADITAAPFSLRAHATFTSGAGQTSEVRYSMDWASPDRYREEFVAPQYSQIKLIADGKLWLVRSAPHPSLQVWQIEDALNISG
jgi:hypothetical protein